jgi:tetratricopeptide (TPR) repeat protein
MNSRRRSVLISLSIILLLVFICLVAPAMSQAINPLSLADSLFSDKAYQPAITEYKRYLYFHASDENTAQIHYRIGTCYRYIQDHKQAAGAFRRAIELSKNDSLRAEYKIALGVMFIASGNYSSAEMIFLRLASFSKIRSIRTKAAFFLGVNYIYRHKWKEVKIYLEENMLSSDSLENIKLRSLLEKAADSRYKSPTLAKWLSTFIPGLGQIYAGKPLQALNAMAINAATGYFLFNTIDKHPSVIEIFSYGSLFHRYWAGNRNNAEQYTRESNEKKDAELEAELLQAIDEMME